jgi:hypothetical protein
LVYKVNCFRLKQWVLNASAPGVLMLTVAAMTEQDLLAELECIESAIARSTWRQRTDATGRPRGLVDADVLALAEQEHVVASELRRRRRSARAA